MQKLFQLNENLVRGLLPKRDPEGHKGSFGHLLSVCGSERYQGAAALAALGAARSGAGLVMAAFPRQAYAPIAAKLTTAIMLPLPGNRQGTLHISALPKLREALQGKPALLLGCGLGLNADTKAITHALLHEAKCPLLLDADGINAAALHMTSLESYSGKALVLTPHPGEMSRLTGLSTKEIQGNRLEIAQQFAEKYNCVMALKGPGTIVAAPGQEPYINTTGNAGLAKGGSGDLLAGMIASLLAQGMPAFEAAACGVYLHGLAADRVAARLSQRGMDAVDCADELPAMFSRFEV